MIYKNKVNQMIAIGFGANIFEWYDFSIYAYLTNTFGLLFFNESNKQLALIKSLMVFSTGFLIRPIGSIFFGYIGDRYGRRFTLQLSLAMMALPTFFIGLLPTYESIGIASLVLLIIFRMIQGFAAGGELPATSCFLYEIAPINSKNFFCSLVASSSMLGVFLGSLIIYLLHVVFFDSQISNWAWRIPFWISGIIVLIIFQLRRSIEETDSFKENCLKTTHEYVKEILGHKKQISLIFLLNAFISIAFYLLFVWMPSYLLVFNNISTKLALFSSSFGLLTLIFLTIIVGYFSSNKDRKKWIMIGIIIIILFSYPLFMMIDQQSFIEIFIAQLIFAVAMSCIDGVINATMGSVFDNKIRCSGISISYTLPTAIFGGLAPTVCSFLIYNTGSKISPVFFLITSGFIALFATIYLYDD